MLVVDADGILTKTTMSHTSLVGGGYKHQFAYIYVNLRSGRRAHFGTQCSWSINTFKLIYYCITSRGGANILLLTPVYSMSIYTYVSKCVHMTP